MKLLIYNLLFWFKPNKIKYIKSDEAYIYSHPDYLSYLLTAISKDLKKEELILYTMILLILNLLLRL